MVLRVHVIADPASKSGGVIELQLGLHVLLEAQKRHEERNLVVTQNLGKSKKIKITPVNPAPAIEACNLESSHQPMK